MNIHEAAKITGLSPKAIRLYESRGVLQVQKIANDYRDYQETELDQLRRIKLFRLAGISISDIKLLNDGIITTDEMVAKRKKELEMAYGHHSEQWEFCDSLIQRLRNKQYNDEHNLDETDEIEKISKLVKVEVGLNDQEILWNTTKRKKWIEETGNRVYGELGCRIITKYILI